MTVSGTHRLQIPLIVSKLPRPPRWKSHNGRNPYKIMILSVNANPVSVIKIQILVNRFETTETVRHATPGIASISLQVPGTVEWSIWQPTNSQLNFLPDRLTIVALDLRQMRWQVHATACVASGPFRHRYEWLMVKKTYTGLAVQRLDTQCIDRGEGSSPIFTVVNTMSKPRCDLVAECLDIRFDLKTYLVDLER